MISNSRALERDYGWRGLCIEGNAKLVPELRKQRSCTVIESLISSKLANVTFIISDQVGKQGYSRINLTAVDIGNDNIHQTLPLDVVLRAHNAPLQMDYLSLDVEKHELAVSAPMQANKAQADVQHQMSHRYSSTSPSTNSAGTL